MPSITLTHQAERTKHRYRVTNPDSLTEQEVNRICQGMYVEAILVNGRLYRCTKTLDRQTYIRKMTRDLK